MAYSTNTEGGITVLLFGPQALSFPEESFQRLRSALTDNPDNAWMRKVITELPEITKLISQQLPKLQATPAATLQDSLKDWLLEIDGSAPPTEHKGLPNALLTPLVVLDQLAQYTQYVQLAHEETGLGSDLYGPQRRPLRTLGFCTGLLSALAVSSASTQAEFRKYGAVAVRLAALIGAVVDAEDAIGKNGESKTFSTACHSSEQEMELQNILQEFPEAYISVNYDQNRATITTSQKSADELQKRFKGAGITASAIGLRGRFHYRSYDEDLQSLISLCDSSSDLQLPDAADAVIPIHSLSGAEMITQGKLHYIALREILVEQSQWGQTFDAMSRSSLANKQSLLVSFGSEKCVPPTAMPRVGGKVIYMTNLHEAVPRLSALKVPTADYSDNDIAVVGMACKLAGADDVDEFWDLNVRGESQHREVPEERFTFDTHWRTVDPKRKWYGNFVRDHDAFDHKFFQKSPREAATQDPQQRLFLQSAYQAVEQSGYFNAPNADRNVGVFVGVCAADYEANIACYAPNAFSATGNLKSFIAGKISHYFGWHGPGLTIDTACSASAVAIHQACRAILSGECTAALAGGTNVMTSPLWFQNLAGASFLSPTGACKPFDAKADGYCRGEGIACVFLKKMSSAIEDGDLVLGSIRSTAVSQNDNCTPIFVPNAPSLTSLFEDVVGRSGLSPKEISLVEAHGTGTPVGDPAEYESIKKVFGGKAVRSNPIPIGSVKGLVGHTECVSGVVALIKVLAIIHHGIIPPQASFQTLSPKLKASQDDMLEIYTKKAPWNTEYRAALINNYGASGSNASMVVSQPPKPKNNNTFSDGGKHAFWFTGLDERSIKDYAGRLLSFLASKPVSSLSNLSFNIYRQSNRTLPQGLIFSSSSVEELKNQLTNFVKGEKGLASTTKKPTRPVILCFGGQISRTIGLDQTVYESNGILRAHLDRCNTTLQSLRLSGLYPSIFEKNTIEDPVKLQTMLFSLQYSCAQSWIDCGIKPAAVVGHSFGELTALCIAGVLSLKDALKVVAARAQLIKDTWGPDPGAMMAVEGKVEDVQTLLERAGKASGEYANVACYNGPTSFTLAGSTKAVDAVADSISSESGLRGKKLSVSNAFHSALVEPLEADLQKIAAGMNFKEPTIRWERVTEKHSSSKVGPMFFASHMRDPVFANHAFQRLHQEYPSAIWLEAGSNSTITKMANRALGSPAASYFAEINITSDSGPQKLTDTFVNLWKEGLTIPHWAHHHTQSQSYSPIILPPYQFEKSRHWLELKKPQQATEIVEAPKTQQEELPTGLYTFVGYQDGAKRSARFRVNTMTKKYEEFVSGHMIVQTAPICPATLEVDITIEALLSLRPDFAAAGLQPEIRNVENLSPICIDPSRMVWLDLQATTGDFQAWDWQMISTNAAGSSKSTHVKGQVTFRSVKDTVEFARYKRLVPHQRCVDLLNNTEPDDVLQGRNMYKVFGEIVDYSEPYRGLQKLVGKGTTSAGRIVKKHSGETWLDVHLSDAFSQVGGFWVNCMTDRAPSDMYIAAGFESWIRRPGYVTPENEADRISQWDVLASHVQSSERAYTTDIFIFEAATGTLSEVILGIHYARMPKSTMSKMLTKLTAGSTNNVAVVPPSTAATIVAPEVKATTPPSTTSAPAATVPAPKVEVAAKEDSVAKEKRSHTLAVVVEVLAELSGLEADVIKLPTNLADLGIDSLVGMEMVHDLESKLECSLDMDQMAEVVTVNDVLQCVQRTLGIEEDSDDDLISSASGTQTPGSAADSATSVSDIEPDMDDKELPLSASDVLDAFGEAKQLTDQFITDFNCSGYMDTINPKQTQLCVALIVEAFEKLDCNIRTAKAGDKLRRISYAPQHGRLVQYLYEVLEKEARLINVDGDNIVRTAVSVPHKTSKEILDSLVVAFPDHNFANRLAFFCGSRLVEVLQGKLDGVKLIFGDEEGRQLVSGLYGDSQLNKLFYKQMEDILTRLVSRLPRGSGPLKVLEMGAGTGGTTKYLVPLLASLGYPVEYTFTDLAPSFVAAARRHYKAYPFMKFRAHDIEKEPAEDLIGTQHIIVASNAVHATHSLTVSLKNIRKALRPDGFLMMLEMTETVPWVDIIFGLLEGWWLFDDGRNHAISHETRWEKELHGLGYGHVDWTDGHLPENNLQRIIIAMASGPKLKRLPIPAKRITVPDFNTTVRATVVDDYVQKFTARFDMPSFTAIAREAANSTHGQCVLVTGATGSLGAHLVAELTFRPDVETVFCLNRISRGSDPEHRQRQSLDEKGLELSPSQLSKLRIVETDTSKPHLGLSEQQYQDLVNMVTAIIHNAWPMSGNRPIRRFEAQFDVMRNLIDLARDAASLARTVTFQFISSIAVVGHYPLITGAVNVPEDRVDITSVLPNGYGDAKFVCERMLDATLHKYPEHFRTMSVRLGQVAGSSKTGYWNALEHLSFLIKSSQTLRALPNFSGELSWTPVDVVAGTLADLVLGDVAPYPVYHIDNPVRQPWEDMIPVLARALSIPSTNILPFKEWVRRVRHFPGSVEKDNPAFKLIDFLDENFLRMSCGGLLLDTVKTREHSLSLTGMGEVSKEVAEGYIRYWKRSGFLAA
ncbi:hypothetical protein GQ43DRAFT_95556 [Delitschia confertaspora ATCC 74209]|uniref:Polyketide synthase n=1 Tax=Delitschia confertaspora ATCC 74209 TaxID=1513339 RepID=A0A9P4JV36_9PLEO|nr:hypothetical protein GQ43DRAFT_95556 [Delitschia confertaspora ATCC 74209]